MAHGIDPIEKVKKKEFQDQQTGSLTQQPLKQKIANVFNSYAGFVNNTEVSVWNNREASSASSQF